MITRNDIFQIAKKLNIPAVGIAPWPLPDDAANYIDTANPCPFINGTLEERLSANTALQSPKSAIVCLFPYYVKTEKPVNLPRYAWGPDYHLVIPDYLKRFGTALQEMDSTMEFEIHCDTSPMADRYMAYLAGLVCLVKTAPSFIRLGQLHLHRHPPNLLRIGCGQAHGRYLLRLQPLC